MKTNKECSFRVGPLVNLVPLVRSLGFDPEEVFVQAGFHLEEFEDPDHRVPYLQASRLLAHCVRVTGCRHIGLLLGERAGPSHLGLAGFLLGAAPTVEAALRVLVTNLDLHDEAGVVVLDIGSEFTSLGYAIQIPDVDASDQIYDLSAVMICQIMKTLCGENWIAASVRLPRSSPKNTLPYRRFFETGPYFDSPGCEVLFSNKYLKQKPPAANTLLYKHLKKEAHSLHALQHNDLINDLRVALRRGLLAGKFAAHQISDSMGIHVRTLHRRLRAADTSFRRELDLVRQSASKQLLADTRLPVCDVANALGYADSSGFIRAFRRWTGTSPSHWRKESGLQS